MIHNKNDDMKTKTKRNGSDYSEFTWVLTESTEWMTAGFSEICYKWGWDFRALEKTLNDELGMGGQEIIETCRKKRRSIDIGLIFY